MFEVTYQEVNKRDEAQVFQDCCRPRQVRRESIPEGQLPLCSRLRWLMEVLKMFKKIVKSIAAIKTENDRDNCYWQIDRAFEEERISFEDHELLYGLAGMVEVA